jgi:TonB family protein
VEGERTLDVLLWPVDPVTRPDTRDDFFISLLAPSELPIGCPILPELTPISNISWIGHTLWTTFDGDSLDRAPRALIQAVPLYPYESRTAGESGRVVVEFIVDRSGAVVDLRVTESTGALFSVVALKAVARWKFEPALRGGRAVRFRMVVPIVFNLNDNL